MQTFNMPNLAAGVALTLPEHSAYSTPMLRWFGGVMVTSKKSPSGESDDSTQPPAETLPHTPTDSTAATSFVRRHTLAVGITSAVLAVVVVSGLTAWGVGTAVADSYRTTASVAVAPLASAPPTAKVGKGLAAGGTKLRGTVQAISGSVWTITTHAGATQQVTVSSATRYGTKKASASASDFPVGTAVLIVEKSGAEGETAVRVVAVKSGTGVPNATATPGT